MSDTQTCYKCQPPQEIGPGMIEQHNKDVHEGGKAKVPHAPLPVKWADRAMYHSAVLPYENRAPGGGARPTVTLLNATPDPLGSLAALCGIYEGRVVRRLADVTDDDRKAAWEAMRATVLNGPLESIQFHFLVEGVTRAFTHQAVRNRFSFFAQESLRFAVVDDEPWTDRQAYPPSLAAKPVQASHWNGEGVVDNPDYGPDEHAYALQRDLWDDAIIQARESYIKLVNAGVPAEEARGLMPHSMTTRYHWIVNIRALLAEAGKRLCTQAQFEWRVVMSEVVKALRQYGARSLEVNGELNAIRGDGGRLLDNGDDERVYAAASDGWQFELMASALQPVCYQEGKCGFMAAFDRGCTIRDRVNQHAAKGTPSKEWNDINPAEWLANPGAART